MDSNSNMELKLNDCEVHVKNPKRILHFCDGTLEEYSDSEETDKTEPKIEDVVDTANMGWGPWLIHKALSTGNTTLAACDYVGEALASFLGITTPKYQYELDEYMRLQRERKAQAEENSANGWLNAKSDDIDANNMDPTVVISRPTVADTDNDSITADTNINK